MGYTLLQIGEILSKADKTMYKIGSVAYDDMFSELDEKLDYERDIIFIYKKAVEYADDYYVGTVKLDTVVERLASKVAIYDYGSLNPIYSDATIVINTIPNGAVLNDLYDVTISNLQNNQILKYNAALGQWVNTGTNAAIRSTQSFTATLNQTIFTTTSPFEPAFLDVFLNGVRLNSSSYTTFGEYQITLLDGCLADDILDVIIYDPVTDILDLAGYVKNTRTITINGVTQDLSADRTWTVGAGDMLKSVYDIDDDGIVDDAEKITIIARNSTGATIHKGKIVYLQGSTGNRPNMILAQANSEAASSKTFGVVVEDIANNADGHVAAIGTLHDLDTRSNATNPFTTDTLLDGDLIWLSATNPGYVTRTPPTQPNHTVFIGVVARTTPSFGRIIYKIQNGFELQELHNVLISSVADKDTLYYDAATSLWKNTSKATWLGGTSSQFVKGDGSFDNSVYLTTAAAASTYVSLSGSYSDPSWINSLPWSKITSAPAFLTTETDPIFTAHPSYGITGIKISNWDDAYTWVANFPTQTGNSGKFLTTNGSVLSWSIADALPSQSGNSGKYLTTNGTIASWDDVNVSVKRNIESFIALPGQTLFNTTTSTAGTQVDVYINGSRLSYSEFAVVSSNQISLSSGARNSDIVDIVFLIAATDIPNPGSGSSAPNIVFITSNYTPIATDDAIMANTALNGTITVTLPLTTAANADGYHIKNIGAGTLNITGTSGQMIDMQSIITISPGSLSSLYLIPYNNNWYII